MNLLYMYAVTNIIKSFNILLKQTEQTQYLQKQEKMNLLL